MLGDFSNTPVVLSDLVILLGLSQQVKVERLVQVHDQQRPDESDSVLVVKLSNLPEGVAEWVFEKSCDVLKHSPLLGIVSWLLGSVHELGEISVSFSGQGSSNHVSSLVHVWITMHKSFDTRKPLPEVRLRVFSIIQILRHFL